MTGPTYDLELSCKGTAGEEDFELWLSITNATDFEVHIRKSEFCILYCYSRIVSAMVRWPVDAFPARIAAGRTQRLCLHRGRRLLPAPARGLYPVAAETRSDAPWERSDDLKDLMGAEGTGWVVDLGVTSTWEIGAGLLSRWFSHKVTVEGHLGAEVMMKNLAGFTKPILNRYSVKARPPAGNPFAQISLIRPGQSA